MCACVRACVCVCVPTRQKGKAKESTTPRTALSFQGKRRAAWVGFEPTTPVQSRQVLYHSATGACV